MMTGSDLAINPQFLEQPLLLKEWDWFLKEAYSPMIATKMGAIFLQTTDGRIDFFDPVEAKLWTVADNEKKLQELLNQQAFILEYFQVTYLVACQKNCSDLKDGQCYSHRLPLCVGGKDMPSNISPLDLTEHFSLHGQLHAQIEALPEGSIVQLNEPSPQI